MKISFSKSFGIIIILSLIISCAQRRFIYLPAPPEYGAIHYRNLEPEQKIAFLMSELECDYSLAHVILWGQYQEGMSRTHILYSLGRPDKISVAKGSWGIKKREQWTYNYPEKDLHLFFKVDELKSWVICYQSTSY